MDILHASPSQAGSEPRETAHTGRAGQGFHPPLQALLVPLFMLILLLLAASLFRARGTVDYWLLERLQRLDLPYLQPAMEVGRALTGLWAGLAIWAVALVALSATRRWLPTLALAVLPLGVVLSEALRFFFASHTAIDPDRLVRMVGAVQPAQLFSPHVTGAVLLGGLLYHLSGGLPDSAQRIALRVFALAAIAVAGLSRIWLGTHWPIDIAAGYALGGLLLAILLWVYGRIEATCGHLPFIHAASIPHDEAQPHAHALTSTIIFNGETVSKIYAPGFVPRAIYWLAFQAEFPYLRNQAALRAAVLRRNLAGLFTEYWFGQNHVARAIGVEVVDGRYAITSAFVAGCAPTNRYTAREFLFCLADRFDEAGLPTWQIDPRQPRAMDNILETPDGLFQIIDLESGLVSPLASPRAWGRALKRGLVPLYDDIYFDLTRAYVRDHEARMRQQRGDLWFEHLLATLDETERATQEWRDGEPRIWGRILGLRRQQAPERAKEANRAYRWLSGAIDRWHEDGRISVAEANTLRTQLQEPRFLAVLPHFGVHLTIGVALRFPFGSIARVSYVLLNLLLGLVLFLTRRIDREAWRLRRDIHSPLVLLISGMPGVGTFAYLASKPVRSNNVLLRVCVDTVGMKFPFRVYERLGLRWLIARPRYLVRGSDGQATRAAKPLEIFGGPQSIVQGLAFVTILLLIADAFVTVIDYLLAPETPGWPDAYRLLDTAGEASLASWYVGFALFFVAALLGVIAFVKRRAADPFARHWLFLALLALAVSIDKHVVIHDPANGDIDLHNRLEMLRLPDGGWLEMAVLSVLAVGLLYRRFLLALPSLTRTLFIAGAGFFVAGEVGFRFIAAYVDDAYGAGSLTHRAATTFQGALAMTGILIVIAALLLYLQAHLGELRVVLSERYIVENNGHTAAPAASARQKLELPLLNTASTPTEHHNGRTLQ